MPSTPADLGYRMPAEWEPHAATWLSWPTRAQTWPHNFPRIPAVWAELVRTLAEFEPVHVLAGGPALAEARAMVGGLGNVTLHEIRARDAWTRDHGPTFLVGPPGAPPALVHWTYNAWGGKYPELFDDRQIPAQIAAVTGYRRFAPGIVLEGGSIDPNGRGTILTSEQCLLNPNRNPHLARADLERYLADYCAARKVLWIDRGVVGDDTDGHVDQLARFVNPTTVVVAVESDPADVNYAALRSNYDRLRGMSDQDGRPLEVVPLPMPGAVLLAGNRLPASYANFYVANGVVIVPQFNDPADAAARDLLAQFFPDRQIRGLPAVDLVAGFGAYHCITQQQFVQP